ncbi:MAG: polysaccharide biosynthesis/export family protein [Deltaproteobacteria bacterium]|nr:polysaccharide biosynthesis/export family protein [Deltaproteobacteria bacterium]
MRKPSIIKIIKNIALPALVMAASLALWAGAALSQEQRQAATAAAAAYQIGPEDALEISVWKNPELSKTVLVRLDGKISLPLIGDVQAAGLTPQELRDGIVERLKEYQATAVVSVIVQDIRSYKVYMIGEIKTPGTYVLKSKTTLLQAIALAGGFTQYASKNSMTLVRQKEGGGEEKIKVRFDDLLSDKKDGSVVLKPGDTVFVP